MRHPLHLLPEYREHLWGGQRLRPGQRTAEAWVIFEQDRVASGPLAGKTLAEAVAQHGPDLLGRRAFARTPGRFPLLVKLLDIADWLSLQIHPNDEQARHLEGTKWFGKTEAWHVLEASPGAELLFGLKPGTTRAEVERAVRGGTIVDLVQRYTVRPGDSLFIRPGLIHALGPGLLIYEVQQTSDITYRVFDWNRPAAAGRVLHIEQSLEVLNPDLDSGILPRPEIPDGGQHALVTCPYFTLTLLEAAQNPIHRDTCGETFHTLTVIGGRAAVEGDGWQTELGRYESLLVPAACGAYRVIPLEPFSALSASVE